MSKYLSPDTYNRIYVELNDMMTWDVIGRKTDYYTGQVTLENIEVDFPNMALADAFVRVYCQKHIEETFFDQARDC